MIKASCFKYWIRLDKLQFEVRNQFEFNSLKFETSFECNYTFTSIRLYTFTSIRLLK